MTETPGGEMNRIGGVLDWAEANLPERYKRPGENETVGEWLVRVMYDNIVQPMQPDLHAPGAHVVGAQTQRAVHD